MKSFSERFLNNNEILHSYLKKNEWTKFEAACLLSGLDPEKMVWSISTYDDGKFLKGYAPNIPGQTRDDVANASYAMMENLVKLQDLKTVSEWLLFAYRNKVTPNWIVDAYQDKSAKNFLPDIGIIHRFHKTGAEETKKAYLDFKALIAAEWAALTKPYTHRQKQNTEKIINEKIDELKSRTVFKNGKPVDFTDRSIKTCIAYLVKIYNGKVSIDAVEAWAKPYLKKVQSASVLIKDE